MSRQELNADETNLPVPIANNQQNIFNGQNNRNRGVHARISVTVGEHVPVVGGSKAEVEFGKAEKPRVCSIL